MCKGFVGVPHGISNIGRFENIMTVLYWFIEKDETCWAPLNRLHPNARIMIMDMLLQADELLPDFIGFVGGFPCPPCSTMGLRKGKGDVRFKPFLKGLDQLKYLAGRRILKFYIIENVPGMLQSVSGEPPLAAWVKEELETRLPHFVHYMWIVQAKEQLLPQSRGRVFWVGVDREVLQVAGMENLKAPTILGNALLHDFLDSHKEMPDIFNTTRKPKQVSNIVHYVARFRKDHYNTEERILCAVCDSSRAPDKTFGEFFYVECCGALRTHDMSKWVVGEVPGKVWSNGRELSIAERARVMGMVPESLVFGDIKKTDVIRWLGNTIPVNSVGAVVACIMEAYVPWEAAVLVNRPVPRDLAAASSTESDCTKIEELESASSRTVKLKHESEAPGPSMKKRRRTY